MKSFITTYFAGIRVLADIRCFLGADRQVAQLTLAGVDDLVRGVHVARRAGDHVTGADGKTLGAQADFALASDYVEHFFVDAMVMEGAGAHPRAQGNQPVTELLRAQLLADTGDALDITAGGVAGGAQGFRQRLKIRLIQIENGRWHTDLDQGGVEQGQVLACWRPV